MYYRYKSKKSNRRIYIAIIWLLILTSMGYLGYTNRQYVFFWKFSYGKLVERLEEAGNIQKAELRAKNIKKLCEAASRYAQEHPLSPDAHFLLGSCYYNYGAALVNMPMVRLFDREAIRENMTEASRQAFDNSIKYMNKGIALGGKTAISDPQRMVLVKSLYYNRFYSIEDIYQCAFKIMTPHRTLSFMDIRFYSIIAIKSNNIEEGIELLKACGNIFDSSDGRLFLASAYTHADKYTNAIMEYKKILDNSKDSNTIKDIHVALGKIYFARSLYNESLEHFQNALDIDTQDSQCKIWIGKNYSAMGNVNRARSILSEVLVTDSENKEAQKLLKHM
ncbi:MAG: tetratricopeptide repeat protein [Spirochaetota bacterium]